MLATGNTMRPVHREKSLIKECLAPWDMNLKALPKNVSSGCPTHE